VKRLIVNADDFGASRGTNNGILHAHRHGIVTSTSLLVNAAASEDAAAHVVTVPALSIGLHLDLDGVSPERVPEELERQLRRFEALIGTPPTHVDTHHNTHRDPRVLESVLAFARHHGLPLRGHSPVHVVPSFYGQWGGTTHLEQITVDGLERILRGLGEGVTELSCHPGYLDAGLRSSYAVEREAEVHTLCDPAARAVLLSMDIHLFTFRDLPGLLAGSPG
jgi:chitin disaccharide deacetylase